MSKIFISYGYGGTENGAVAGTKKAKDFNLEMGLTISQYLREKGHTVIEHRKTDTNFGRTSSDRINAVVQQALGSQADYFLEIHHNSSGAGGNGVECIYSMSGSGKNLATAICNDVAKLGFNNRGAKTRVEGGEDYYGVIRGTQNDMETNMLYCSFIDSEVDMELFKNLGTDPIAEKIATAIDQELS